jgi:catechol 2,3-dioxygenase-like lactoylglutathione lyase family enzyme
MTEAPRLAGIHHLKLPVSDVERSRAWYESRLGYVPQAGFVEQGTLMGVGLARAAVAARLTALGEEHAGVHQASAGWIRPLLHDPDGHEVRFSTHEHRTGTIHDPREAAPRREAEGEGA